MQSNPTWIDIAEVMASKLARQGRGFEPQTLWGGLRIPLRGIDMPSAGHRPRILPLGATKMHQASMILPTNQRKPHNLLVLIQTF